MPRAREVAHAVWRDPESAMPYERPEARRGHRAVLRQIAADGRGQKTAISYQPSAVLRYGGNPKPPGPPQPGGRLLDQAPQPPASSGPPTGSDGPGHRGDLRSGDEHDPVSLLVKNLGRQARAPPRCPGSFIPCKGSA